MNFSNLKLYARTAQYLFTFTSLGVQPRFPGKPTIKQAGKNVIFEVLLEADPAPQLRWTKGGVEIKSAGRYKTDCKTTGIQHIISLEISQVKADDGGEYLVTATNKLGDSTATINLNIGQSKAQANKAPKFLEKPEIRMDKPKNTVIMSCKLEAKPKATLTWFLNDKEIQEVAGKRKFVVQDQQNDVQFLEIHVIGPKPEDGGTYRINAKNAAGESNANINLNLQGQKNVKAPQFEQPKIYQDKNGRDVVIECRSTGDPDPNYTWYQNGREVRPKLNKFVMQSSKDGAVFVHTLRIVNFMNADTGTYKLVAKNTHGDATSTMEIKMPHIVGLPTVNFEGTKKAVLEVRVESGTKPTAVWTHNSKQVRTTGRFKTQITEEKGVYVITLTITDFQEKDAGSYDCEISNGVGVALQSVNVKLPDTKPKLPQILGEPGSQQVEAGRAMQLDVQYTAGTATPQAALLREGTNIGSDPRLTVRVDESRHYVIVNLRGVKPEDKGTYTLQLLVNGEVCDKTTFGLTVIQEEETEDLDEVPELQLPSNKGSRRSSSTKKDDDAGSRRASQDRPGLLDPKALEQSLQARRDSMTNRRTSLADAIPGFAGLKHREAPKAEKEYFIEEAQDQKIREGSVKALIKCTFCKPTSRFRWYKNKLEIFQGPKYNFLQDGKEYALEIKRIAMEDVGKYTCKCNEISTTCTLIVEERKQTYYFNQKLPKTAEVVRGKDLTVECSVSDPRAPVVWYHKGEKVEYVAGKVEIKRRENRCILRIVRARPEQEGEYCCMVEGDETYIDIALEDPDWFFTRELKDIQCYENDDLVALECEVSDRDADVTWSKNGEPIPTTEKYETASEKRVKRILRVKKLVLEDQGDYVCKVAKKTTLCHLTVRPDVEFRQSLIDTKGIETKRKELECRAFNPKRYPVQWFKNGELIQMNDRIQTQEVEGSLYLIFNTLEMSDTGDYTCKIGNHETIGHLQVQECDKPPTVDLTNFNNAVSLKKGDNFQTAIPFKGFPVPTVALFCNGEPCSEMVKLKPFVKDDTVELKLQDAARLDTGNYELKLKNESGEVSVPLKLNVYDRPGPPRGPLELTSLSAKKCTLEWDPPADDGGKPIKHYVVEKMDTADGQWKLVKNSKTPKCDVDLEEGKKYKFRVRAVNDEGESENLETEKEILARDICDPPDPPTGLTIEDWDRDHADLKWKPPRRDNGAPVLKYVIEGRPKSTGKWVTLKDVPETSARVPLTENEEYEFRVSAVNKAGTSEPSEATKPMVAKPRRLKPFIIKTGIQPVRVKVGQTVTLDLDYRGEPDPIATWSKGDKILETTQEIQLTFEERSAHLKIKAAERKDTASYTLRVYNDVGEDQATIEVVALGKPSRPVGPLEVTDVTKNSAQLTWKKPEDDGGSPITHYVVEKMNLSKKRWEPVAEVRQGTTVTATKLDEGQPYLFRVKAVSDQGESEPLETENEIVAKNPFEKPEPPGRPEIVDHDRDRIDIKWEPPLNDGGAPIKGYIVERKETKSQRWLRVVKDPVRGLEFTDDTVREGKDYQYRVMAVNEAGPSEPSPPSDSVVAKPSREAPKINLSQLPLGMNQEIRLRAGEPLHLPIPISGAPRPSIVWTKDDSPLADHVKVAEAEDKTSVDIPSTVRDDSGQYRLQLKNDYGQDEAKINVIVMDKPTRPRDVEAIDVFEDKCKVTWKPPSDDGGCQITDYLVDMFDESIGEWERVQGVVAENSIPVKGLIKGHKYRFRVMAVNMIGTSEPSETKTSIEAKNPYEPPGPPENLDIDSFDRRSVTLVWKAPKDDGGNAIQGYLIEKRIPGGEWRKATSSLVPNTQAKVTNVDEGQTYEFRVTAVNAAGPGEPSTATKPHKIKDPTYPPGAPENVRTELVNRNGCKLSWNKPRRDGGLPITGYVIEKKGDGDEWKPVQETKDLCAFIPMKEGETGQFRIRAVNDEGPGEPSKPTDVLTAVDTPEAPHICRPDECIGGPGSGVGGLKDVTLKAGQDLNLAAAWFGHPKPTVQWTCSDKPVKVDGTRVKTADEPPPPPAQPGPGGKLEQPPGGTAKLDISKVRRADGGVYELTLTNEQGQVKTSCHVEVLDVPGAPQGPLEATEVDAEEITLKWKPPLDDGGQPISNYILEKRPKGTDSWQTVSAFLNTTTATVHNLKTGQEYEFRVKAENAMGVSEPLTTETAIKAKYPYEPPSGMSKPTIDTTTDDSVSLSWEPPLRGPTTGYIVEKRPKGSKEWTKANMTNVLGTNFTVRGLPKGKEFEFRVVPYNLAGLGEPSEPTEMTKVQFPITPPKVGRDAPREITARVDKPFKIVIPFSGSPPDKVTLTKDGVPVPLEGDRFSVEVAPGEVIITDSKAEKKDAGQYKVDLENEKGSDSVPVTVKVVGPPEPPKGPLDISNIKADSCSLAWNPPTDTGGSPVTNYVVEKMNTKTGEWTPVSSFVRSPTYDVAGLDEGGTYKFRVRAANEYGVSEPLEAERSIVAENPFTAPGAPSSLTPSDVDATAVTLEWTKPRSDGGRRIQGYVVQYKPANADEWKDAPMGVVKGLTAKVDGLKKGEKYMFRVAAKNEAGVGEYCTALRPVECKPKFTTADAPGTPTVEDVGKNYVDLAWTKPLKDGGARITGYVVEKRKKYATDWEPATTSPVAGNQVHLDNLDENAEYEFRVRAVNAAGPGEPSNPTELTKICPKRDVPKSPEDLQVTDIFADNCKLVWKPPEYDGGCPITDYVVEKCDATTGEWERVPTIVTDTSCPVRGLVEGKRYLFRVAAVNMMGRGEPVETTTAITAKNPFDAPDSPEDAKITSFDKRGVNLAWKPPENDGGNPIKGYLIEKRTPGGEWKPATADLVPGKEARITGLEPGETYEFRVSAVNDAGPGRPSKATPPQVIKDPTFPPSSPENLNVDTVNKNGVKLSWQKPRKDGGSKITGYQVEKKSAEGDWVPVKQTSEPCAFIPMKEGEEAQFRVKAINEEGPGEPTRPTAVLTAKDQPAAPRIVTPDECVPSMGNGVGGLKDVKIKAGQELRLAAAWFGSPEPQFAWTLDDKPIKGNETKSLESSEPLPPPAHPGPGGPLELPAGATAVLTIPKVRRADSGKYKLTLVNDQGQTSTSCDVEVIDVPAAPSGPLEATEVKANEITLKWKAPEDDGGEPITNYILEKKPKNGTTWEKVSGFLNQPTATVRNLDEGTEYEFRVMAENAMGISEPLVTEKAIKAKHPFDVPSGMSKPTVEDTTDDSVTLSWEPPLKGPVTGYIVEKRPKGEKGWTKANVGPISGTKYTVKNLPKGKEIDFRVIPVNAAGPGEPSEPTGFVKVQNPITAPKIAIDAPKEVNARLGEPCKIRIPFVGSPPDTVEMKKDGVPVPLDSDRFSVEVTPNEVIITDKKVAKEDDGPCEITLKNEKGEATAPVTINVQGPPEAPKGPLEITDVKADSCKLSWNPPKDNGGSPVSNYIVEKLNTKTGEWTPVSRFVRGPEYEVTGLDEGAEYKFRVRAENEFGVSEPLEAEKSIVAENPATTPSSPSGLQVADVDADKVTLEWKKPRDDGGRRITGYVVEYKPVNSDEWLRGPSVKEPTATVPGLKKGEKYVFRVAAKNDQGTGEPTAPTRPVECKPKYTTADSPGSPVVDDVDKNSAEISWSRPIKDGGSRITGYVVEKRKKGDDEWLPATTDGKPVTGTRARIDGLDENGEYEFRVKPVNAAGVGAPSEPSLMTKIGPKTTHPDSPEEVNVEEMFADHCTLSWKPPEKDGGLPITDYIVEKCDALTGDWVRVPAVITGNKCPIRDLVEGKRYRFRVTAVNAAGPSEPTETAGAVTAKNPFDAPDAPEALKLDDYDKHSATLSWTPPENDGGNPIKGFLIEQRVGERGEWKPATAGLVTGSTARLTGLEQGQTYEFRVSAVNDAGPGRPSRATRPQVMKDRTFPAGSPEGLKVDKVNKNGVKLSWQKPRKDGGSKITGYQVEKKDAEGNWVPVKQTTEPCAFIPMKEGETAQYRVRAVNEEGPGEPTRPTPEVTAEDQPEAPRIATPDECVGGIGTGVGGLKDVTIKAGQDLKLPVAWFGHPAPTFVWTLNGKTITPDGKRVTLENGPLPPPAHPGPGGPLEQSAGGTTVLNVGKVSRADKGRYQLTVMNDLGQATTSCEVEVLDAPGAPTGPLEPVDVKADEITLKWKAPEDDGGQPITNYVLEKRPKGSDTWQKVSGFLKTPTATVRNLDEGQEYEFRVMAENEMGLSEPLVTTKAIKARHPFDVPSGMSQPVVEGTTDDSISVSWEPPENGPVTGYIVEKRAKGDRQWSRANMHPITGTEYTVKGLPTGKEYEIRVIPVNAAGPGEPSEPTPLTKVQEPVVAPRIGLGAPNEIKATSGEPFRVRIPFSGSLPDEVTITKDGVPVSLDDDRFSVTIAPGEVIVTDAKANKDDAGDYKITLKNSKGEDSLPVKVKIMGPPASPKGPLKVSDVTADSCTLSWSAPTDDGGSPVSNYIVEKQDQATGEWVPVSRFVRGTEYDVTGLEDGKKYKFRVRAVNDFGAGEPLELDQAITAQNPASVPDAPSVPEVADVDADTVTLEWAKPKNDGGGRITSYVVEVKPVTGGDWEKAQTGPVKGTSATVTGLKKGERYIFRVAAKNDVGVGEHSRPTRPVECKPKYTTPSSPGELKVDDIGKNHIDLSWTRPTKDGGARISGYVVEKRKKDSPDWEPATEDEKPITSNYVHIENLDEDGEYQFRVTAVNAAGPGEPSAPTPMIKIQERKAVETPEFLSKIRPATAPIGGTAVFEARIDGQPTPEVKWFRDGIPLTPSARVKINPPGPEGVATIELSDLDDRDGGDITCQISNPLGKNTCSARLEVLSIPKALSDIEDKVAAEGDLIKVKVPYSGHGTISLKLKRDGHDVPESPKVKIMDLDGMASIQLKDLTKDMSGRYTLEIGNESGSTSVPFNVRILSPPGECQGPLVASETTPFSTKLTWKPPRNDGGAKVTNYVVEKMEVGKDRWIPVSSSCKQPTCDVQGLQENVHYIFRVAAVNDCGQGDYIQLDDELVAKYPFDKPGKPGDLTCTEVGGDFVNLSWIRPSTDGGGRLRGYLIDKREVGAPNWSRVTPNPVMTLSYNVPNLIEDKTYEFRVIAVNDAGESEPSVIDRPVLVKDPKAVTRPTFVSGLKPQTVNEGRDVVFECEVDCPSPYQIVWCKGPLELVESQRIEMTKEGKANVLTIHDARLEDAEEYSVKVYNAAGSKVSRAPLQVKSKPKIRVPARWQEPTEWDRGDSITIKLPYTAFPKPKAKWLLNGNELRDGKQVNTVLKDRHAIINLSNVTEELAGKLTLELENDMGSDSATVELRINDRPPPPINLKVEGVSDGSALLSWTMPPDTGYISQYIIERREAPDGNWIRAGVNRFSTYNCEGLENGKQYQFRVIAENLHGRSDPCPPTEPTQIAPESRKRGGRPGKGEPRGEYSGPPIDNYDRFFRNIWSGKEPLPAQVHKGESVYDYYDILEELGSGAFGTVHRCREKATGDFYAVKFINIDNPEDQKVVHNEIDVMKSLHHPKLIFLHEAFEDKDETALVMELLSGGELFDRIADDSYQMNEAEVVKYIRQVCEAVKHMHDNNIIHLDIKPEDILCETGKSTNIKLADFGLSKRISPNEQVRVTTATPEFAAPEIARYEPVGFYTDMWAIGVLSYVLLSGLSPFSGANTEDTLNRVANGDYTFDHENFRNISDKAKDFIRKLLQKQPNQRMTVYEALEHPWLNEGITDEQRRRIPASRYKECQQRMHERIGENWSRTPAIGHLANYSSLRQNRRQKYKIHDTEFDRREFGPRFIKWPHNQTVPEGNTAQFSCRVLALSEPVVTWAFDGVQLTQSVKYMQRYAGHDYSLKISRVKTDDAGHYTVRAENSYGRREYPVMLTVQPVQEIKRETIQPTTRKRRELTPVEMFHEEEKPPRFAFHLRNRYIQEGVNVKLTCTADGNPMPTMTWYKDGRELRKGEGNYEIESILGMSSLELYSCTERDSGNYSCVAKNKMGEDETDCKVIVEESRVRRFLSSRSRQFRSTSQQPSSYAYSSQRSERQRGSDYSSLTRVTERYSSEVREIPEDVDGWEAAEPRSTRRVVEQERSSMRTTEASHAPRSIAPELRQELLPPPELQEGERLTLTVEFARAKPPPTITWFHNGREITSGGSCTILNSSDGCTSRLTITQVTVEDGGVYEVRAQNASGTAISQTQVTIRGATVVNHRDDLLNGVIDDAMKKNRKLTLENEVNNVVNETDDLNATTEIQYIEPDEIPPVFVTHPSSQILQEGDSLLLECRVGGYPIPDIMWTHDGMDIYSAHKMSQENEYSRLELPSVSAADSGSYECNASNNAGKATSVAHVFVKGPDVESKGPEFVSFPQSATLREGESVDLQCSFLPQAASKVEWQRNGIPLDPQCVEFDQDGQSSVCHLSDLKVIKNTGTYSVLATDANGATSTWNFAIQVIPSDFALENSIPNLS
ncbi:unnamed protein product [Calicophoron daubneyi]|uniref:non-specific serine/threonine protein kinase n=1 Tax=Calicophoron daubneyi TaxID=300641 RepID=A0AAV2TKS6_CALDB